MFVRVKFLMINRMLNVKEAAGFKYIDAGNGDETLVFLHGLFGALSNWKDVIAATQDSYRLVIPMLPIYDIPRSQAKLEGLLEFTERFVSFLGLRNFTLIGNSLGGHLGLIYTLKNKAHVKKLVLTGSSGLFEHTMGGSYPKRGNYEYIKDRVAYTFFDPEMATKQLVDEVFEVTRSIPKCMRMVSIAKSAQRHNMAHLLHEIKIPTLLIWGLNDTITPPSVAHDFNRLIPDTELRFIDKCGHAPMMEHPKLFNDYLNDFMERRN